MYCKHFFYAPNISRRGRSWSFKRSYHLLLEVIFNISYLGLSLFCHPPTKMRLLNCSCFLIVWIAFSRPVCVIFSRYTFLASQANWNSFFMMANVISLTVPIALKTFLLTCSLSVIFRTVSYCLKYVKSLSNIRYHLVNYILDNISVMLVIWKISML